MNCPKCGKKAKPDGSVDEFFYFYKCICGWKFCTHNRRRNETAIQKG
jgi:hypothetical protein